MQTTADEKDTHKIAYDLTAWVLIETSTKSALHREARKICEGSNSTSEWLKGAIKFVNKNRAFIENDLKIGGYKAGVEERVKSDLDYLASLS